MIVRAVNPEEFREAVKIQSIAFSFSQNIDELKNHDEDDYKTGRAFFNNKGKMCACLDLLPYIVKFNGYDVPMGGIGGVATLPEELGKKYAQRILHFCLNEMYEQGNVFSYLYPFSHAYYRKFGYEHNMRLNDYTISIESLRHFKLEGHFELCENISSLSIIEPIYKKFIENINLAVVRGDYEWKKFFGKDPFKDTVYIYSLKDENGLYKGYVKFTTVKKQNEKHQMVINELIWLDFDALQSIFAFLSGHAPQYRTIQWRAPMFLDLDVIFSEPNSLTRSIVTSGMNRIINVQKCFLTLDLPDFSGNLVIEVNDKDLTENTGCYNLEWEDGKIEISKSTMTPDIECDIVGLTQMVTGFCNPLKLLEYNKIRIHNKHRIAESLFSLKKLYINDHF